jgi:hypothetical protein
MRFGPLQRRQPTGFTMNPPGLPYPGTETEPVGSRPEILGSSRGGAPHRRHETDRRAPLMGLRLLQSLTTRRRPQHCCSFAVPLMRFGPLQHTGHAGRTFDNPGLPHPVRSAFRVSHPPDGFPSHAPSALFQTAEHSWGSTPPELLPPNEAVVPLDTRSLLAVSGRGTHSIHSPTMTAPFAHVTARASVSLRCPSIRPPDFEV